MEVMPVMEVRAVIDVAISVAHTTATEHGRGAKAATMDSNATASEPAAMERSTATSEPTAVESATTAAKPAASTTAKTTTAAAMTAMPDFGRQIVGCKFR
jgi:cell division septation protein DedD